MNKTHFLCLLLSVILFSCFKKETNVPRKTTGKINTISVIIDDQLWNGEIGDSIRNKFASPVIGLPEEEPLFTINQYPVKLMEGFAIDTRTIIVVKKGFKKRFEIKNNQYATPQKVFHISGITATEVLDLIEQHYQEMIELIEQGEIKESQRINKKVIASNSFIGRRFNIAIQIPSQFKVVMRKPNFVWLKKKIISGSSSLLLYQVPMKTIKKERVELAILKMRDSIGQFIQGREPNTYMISETGYTPYFFKSKLDNRLAYETRGTWQLQNDYMSGPFINYAIVDTANNRLLVLEGFCYSPSKEKRDVMHELEAIIHSVHLLKNNTFTPHKNKIHGIRMED
jgi:hypothetical protein